MTTAQPTERPPTKLPTVRPQPITDPSWDAERTAGLALWQHWKELRNELDTRYSAKLRASDPRLPATATMHLAHNWHIKGGPTWDILQRANRAASRLYRAYKYADTHLAHPYHELRGEDGRYLWCKGCLPHRSDYDRELGQ